MFSCVGMKVNSRPNQYMLCTVDPVPSSLTRTPIVLCLYSTQSKGHFGHRLSVHGHWTKGHISLQVFFQFTDILLCAVFEQFLFFCHTSLCSLKFNIAFASVLGNRKRILPVIIFEKHYQWLVVKGKLDQVMSVSHRLIMVLGIQSFVSCLLPRIPYIGLLKKIICRLCMLASGLFYVYTHQTKAFLRLLFLCCVCTVQCTVGAVHRD